MNKIALLAVAGIASTAAAQATINVSASETTVDTTNGPVTVRVSVSITGAQGLTTFDNIVSATGAAATFGNQTFDNPFLFTAVPGITEFTDVAGGFRATGSAPLFSGLDVSGLQYSFDVTFEQGALGQAEVGVSESGFSPLATFGLFSDAYAEVNVNNASFNLVPAPGSLALLGLGGLAAARRRR